MAGLVAALAACGGGDRDKDTVPTNYLSKYQGTWYEMCATPIQFSPGVSSNASTRIKFVVSAPNASGAVTFDIIEEFHDSIPGCWATGLTPYATVRTAQVPVAGYAGQQHYPVAVGTALHDVLSLSRPASVVEATGSGVSSVMVNGTPVWRITFSDGNTVDRSQQAAALTGSALPLLKITVNGGTADQFFMIEAEGYSDSFFQR
ncbi:hypothetical protein LRS03_12445 [Rhizobacter sp. J219]|uniref:hypothetical protein n=1 Tax=Rhizobacter sp. J219 TaxID=2898430 RepID=UPI0021512627|nr:hypothetical protein [Rhizobacter sp. J219]MCR5883619.1 hypothetical protein [Rhizobacter sp. J219]